MVDAVHTRVYRERVDLGKSQNCRQPTHLLNVNVSVSLTPEQLRAISNCLSRAAHDLDMDTWLGEQLDTATRAVAAMGHEIYEHWSALPDGSALKRAYGDDGDLIWSPVSAAELAALDGAADVKPGKRGLRRPVD